MCTSLRAPFLSPMKPSETQIHLAVVICCCLGTVVAVIGFILANQWVVAIAPAIFIVMCAVLAVRFWQASHRRKTPSTSLAYSEKCWPGAGRECGCWPTVAF